MDKLKMHTPDLAEENYRKLAEMFPNAVTETINEAGEVVRAIDADVLRQEISSDVVEGPQERYQFTWPDKKKSVVLANTPIAKTLRLDRSKSVGRDGTCGSIDSENIYIEGDNLDALKLLQETYLGKVKMIYIDPPYNTGSDFIYKNDFSQSTEKYIANNGQFDEDGNCLALNPESNGRFHTDWLNMLYPRLRIAKDLLANDGAIFISIDDNEQENLKKICDEIFDNKNFIAQIAWKRKKEISNDSKNVSIQGEYILCYGRSEDTKLNLEPLSDEYVKKAYNEATKEFPLGKWRPVPITVSKGLSGGGYTYTVTTPSGTQHTRLWAYPEKSYKKLLKENKIYFGKDNSGIPQRVMYISESKGQPISNYWSDVATNKEGKKAVLTLLGGNIFETPKPTGIIKKLMSVLVNSDDDIIIDFFSGSATTAHAVMQLNAEDSGNRKFIMVQIQEVTGEKSAARKAGYETICDIGEERIRRAGVKIREETGADIDYGFRVFRVDSTNMEDVYYNPAEYNQGQLDMLADNIKPDRTPEDLLFQVILDLGILLSSSIEETVIDGKKVFSVADGYLLACFDTDVTEKTVTEIAKRHPFYAVFRDSSMASDSVATNFEQIFAAYSPKTVRKVL